MASFLGKKPTEEQLIKLTNHLRFDSFKKNEAVNNEKYKEMGIFEKEGHFIRNGCLPIFFIK